MRSSFAALVLVCGAAACDMNEGPVEETREAEEAAVEGANPDRVAREAEDVNQDGMASTAEVGTVAATEETRASLDTQITRHEAWLAGVRREIEAGTRAENPDTKDTLAEIEHNLKEARDEALAPRELRVQELQRDARVEHLVLRLEDASHPAVADETEQAVLVVDELSDLGAHRLLRG